jgi:hypothetical protein
MATQLARKFKSSAAFEGRCAPNTLVQPRGIFLCRCSKFTSSLDFHGKYMAFGKNGEKQ